MTYVYFGVDFPAIRGMGKFALPHSIPKVRKAGLVMKLNVRVETNILGFFQGDGSIYIGGIVWLKLEKREDVSNYAKWFEWRKGTGLFWDVWFGRWNLQLALGRFAHDC